MPAQPKGISLQEISRAIKISVHVLEAIERNETDPLACGLFMRAYLRAYASQVGLNPAQIVGEFRAAHEEPESDVLRDLRIRLANRGAGEKRWATAILVFAGLALLVFSLFFSRVDRPGGPEPGLDTVPVIDEELRPTNSPVTPA